MGFTCRNPDSRRIPETSGWPLVGKDTDKVCRLFHDKGFSDEILLYEIINQLDLRECIREGCIGEAFSSVFSINERYGKKSWLNSN